MKAFDRTIVEESEIHPKMYLYRRIVSAKRYIDDHYRQQINLSDISDCACLSKYHFLRQFKLAYGKSPHQYLTQVRINAAKRALREGRSTSEVCFTVGFESIPSFTRLFKKHVGMTPGKYHQLVSPRRSYEENVVLGFIPGCFASQLR